MATASSGKSVSSKSTISTTASMSCSATAQHKRGDIFGGSPKLTANKVSGSSDSPTGSDHRDDDFFPRSGDRLGAFPQMPANKGFGISKTLSNGSTSSGSPRKQQFYQQGQLSSSSATESVPKSLNLQRSASADTGQVARAGTPTRHKHEQDELPCFESRGGGYSIVPSPSNTTSAASVASAGSGRFPVSVTSTKTNGIIIDIMDSVKQKGIAKRKRKEYAKDSRYSSVRRVVDELNKAIAPDKRRSAVARACAEFDHGIEATHSAELYLGAANVLCLVLSMSEKEDEIQNICAALEMVYRAEREAVIISYQDVGAALVPLLLRLLDRCENGRKVMAEAIIANISRILLHMTRISELRVPLVGHQGMLTTLERVGTLPLSAENRILRMRLLANLANSEGNKIVIFERSTLMEAVMKVGTLDKSESAREYSSAILMDLSSCQGNQIAMAKMEKVLATLVKLAIVEAKTETREYAVSGLQNLAFEKRNRMQLVSYGSGVVVEALKKTTSSDPNDKTRRRSAGALTNLACDQTAEIMATHQGLLEALAQASVSDSSREVQQRTALALTKLANSVVVTMPCWDSLLSALVVASRCTASDGIVSAMFRVKARSEENRVSMANHPGLLEALAEYCLRASENGESRVMLRDCDNASKAIAHLANEPRNHKIICSKYVLSALVNGASLDGPAGTVTRDACVLSMVRMAMEHSNRPMMARFPGMITSIAKATEREMKEENDMNASPTSTGQPRLAKPLLMSLLVAM
mmetsp:Transcript_12218/g.28783  ORF Transcript_12218/g.28783 Transcript_12218/m.28783 type:complete len:757 (+) Transcript_12218:409-2679(+)